MYYPSLVGSAAYGVVCCSLPLRSLDLIVPSMLVRSRQSSTNWPWPDIWGLAAFFWVLQPKANVTGSHCEEENPGLLQECMPVSSLTTGMIRLKDLHVFDGVRELPHTSF